MEYVAYKVSEKQTEMMNCSRKKGVGGRPGGEGVEGDNGQRHRSRAPAGNDASLYLPLSSSTAPWDVPYICHSSGASPRAFDHPLVYAKIRPPTHNAPACGAAFAECR